MSSELLTYVKSFDINYFDPLLSDIHKAVSFSISCHSKANIIQVCNTSPQVSGENDTNVIDKPIWIKDNREIFINSLEPEAIENVLRRFDQLSESINTECMAQIDNIMSDISNIYMNAATKADMIKTCSAKCDKTPYQQNLSHGLIIVVE